MDKISDTSQLRYPIKIESVFDKSNITETRIETYFTNPNMYLAPETKNGFHQNCKSLKLLKLHGSINWNINDEIFIVPPTWNKANESIRKLWEYAYEEIKSAKRIIIIGYSFPDTDIYVKSLFALALNENKILQNIYFINPDNDYVMKNSLSFLEKYFRKYCSYNPWTFSQFIDSQDGKTFVSENLNRQITFRHKRGLHDVLR